MSDDFCTWWRHNNIIGNIITSQNNHPMICLHFTWHKWYFICQTAISLSMLTQSTSNLEVVLIRLMLTEMLPSERSHIHAVYTLSNNTLEDEVVEFCIDDSWDAANGYSKKTDKNCRYDAWNHLYENTSKEVEVSKWVIFHLEKW